MNHYHRRVADLLTETNFSLKIDGMSDTRLSVLSVLATIARSEVWIQVCSLDAEGNSQNGRKWWISPHACDSEIVMTGFAAWAAWLEHEAREAYTFRGVRVANPHWDVADLAARPPRTECRACPSITSPI